MKQPLETRTKAWESAVKPFFFFIGGAHFSFRLHDGLSAMVRFAGTNAINARGQLTIINVRWTSERTDLSPRGQTNGAYGASWSPFFSRWTIVEV